MAERRLRRHDRVEEKVAVQVMWKDRYGHDRLLSGHTVDVSQDGLRVELKERIDEGVFVNFRADGLKLHGTASVRRCTRQGAKYVIGLQFTGGLRWKTASAPKEPGTDG
jgi:hypothetical protein